MSTGPSVGRRDMTESSVARVAEKPINVNESDGVTLGEERALTVLARITSKSLCKCFTGSRVAPIEYVQRVSAFLRALHLDLRHDGKRRRGCAGESGAQTRPPWTQHCTDFEIARLDGERLLVLEIIAWVCQEKVEFLEDGREH